ncbi:MAG: DUF1697 domain-containing protein [Anaerolineales bacterium]
MKYIAFLRGINSSSGTKVSMSELKRCFEKQGFKNVSTYVNSGNVLFESSESASKLVTKCAGAFRREFNFAVSMLVMPTKKFISTVDHAPS